MFLSVIIPVYNSGKYLTECLDSCLNQDILSNDYEIICINDGSNDNSGIILDKYAAKHPNIRVLHKENSGVSETRNIGLDCARGDYVAFLDSDDFFAENVFGSLKHMATSYDCDRIAFPMYEFFDSLSKEELEKKKNGQLLGKMIYEDTLITTCLFRASILHKHRIRFNRQLTHGEDTLWLHQYKCASREKIDYCLQPVYFYRRNHHSATMNTSVRTRTQAAYSYGSLASILVDMYQKQKEAKDSHTISTANYLMLILRKSLEQIAQLPQPEFRIALQQLKKNGLFPFRQPLECTYTWQECVNEPSGTGKLRNIFRYYSIYPLGLFLAALPYRMQRFKVKISRTLRSNPVINKVLDSKNNLLRRG